jgi:hypothetical protein
MPVVLVRGPFKHSILKELSLLNIAVTTSLSVSILTAKLHAPSILTVCKLQSQHQLTNRDVHYIIYLNIQNDITREIVLLITAIRLLPQADLIFHDSINTSMKAIVSTCNHRRGSERTAVRAGAAGRCRPRRRGAVPHRP